MNRLPGFSELTDGSCIINTVVIGQVSHIIGVVFIIFNIYHGPVTDKPAHFTPGRRGGKPVLFRCFPHTELKRPSMKSCRYSFCQIKKDQDCSFAFLLLPLRNTFVLVKLMDDLFLKPGQTPRYYNWWAVLWVWLNRARYVCWLLCIHGAVTALKIPMPRLSFCTTRKFCGIVDGWYPGSCWSL